MAGVTFDTGALIKLVDRQRIDLRKVYETARARGWIIRVPAVVVAEWWRAGQGERERERWLRSMRVEPVDEPIARVAGVAVGLSARRNVTIDAIVLATAAVKGDHVVYTSDPDDLSALRDVTPPFQRLEIVAV